MDERIFSKYERELCYNENILRGDPVKHMRRLGIVILSILLILGGLFALPKPTYDKTNVWRKEANDNQTLVMAHAGGKGVYPDNTMKAFQYAYDLGVDVLEMDLQMTADNVLVLRHGENETGNMRDLSNCDTVIWDETYQYLYDNCNVAYHYEVDGAYPYRDMTQVELIADGVYLTTLEELFNTFGDSILYNIEIKADADAPRTEVADELYDLMMTYDVMENVLVATNFHDISSYIATTYPNVTLSTSHDEAQSMIIPAYTLSSVFYTPDSYAALQLPMSFGLPVIGELNLTTKLLIQTAHRHNMAMHYWTINDEETMRYLIEQGADGIITDYPELLQEIIAELQ